MKSLPQPAAVFCPALIGISQSAFAHAVHNLKFGVPPDKNKGAALKRFMAREGIDWSIAAGDGIPDIPMLEAANMAILQDRLSGMVENPQQCVLTGPQCFSDFICDELSGLLSFFAKTDT